MAKENNVYMFVGVSEGPLKDENVLIVDESLYMRLTNVVEKLMAYENEPLDGVASFVPGEAKFYPGAWITSVPENLRVITKEHFEEHVDVDSYELTDSIRLEFFCQDGMWRLDFTDPSSGEIYVWRGDMEIALDQYLFGVDPQTLVSALGDMYSSWVFASARGDNSEPVRIETGEEWARILTLDGQGEEDAPFLGLCDIPTYFTDVPGDESGVFMSENFVWSLERTEYSAHIRTLFKIVDKGDGKDA